MADASVLEHEPLHPLLTDMGLDTLPVPARGLLNCIGVVRMLAADSPHKAVPAVVYGFKQLGEYAQRLTAEDVAPVITHYLRDETDRQLKTNLSRVVPIGER